MLSMVDKIKVRTFADQIITSWKAWLNIMQHPFPTTVRTTINTLRPRQNDRYFSDDIFKCNLLKENISISISISLKFVPKGPINNLPALVQIMAWHRPGDKPLSEPMMANLLTHICVTRPQWLNLQQTNGSAPFVRIEANSEMIVC